MKSFRDIISTWPSRRDLAEDCEVGYGVVQQWWNRDSVPPEHWSALVNSASMRGLSGVSLEVLACLAASKKKTPHDKEAA